MPCGARTCATTSRSSDRSSDDVEVDPDAFAGRGGLDQGAEPADDAALAADDLADVLFVDLELVDRGVAILDLTDLDRVGLVDERPGHVLDQTLQVWLELLEFFVVFPVEDVRVRRGRLGH